jgi:hypothetical protein
VALDGKAWAISYCFSSSRLKMISLRGLNSARAAATKALPKLPVPPVIRHRPAVQVHARRAEIAAGEQGGEGVGHGLGSRAAVWDSIGRTGLTGR